MLCTNQTLYGSAMDPTPLSYPYTEVSALRRMGGSVREGEEEIGRECEGGRG